MLAIKFLSPFLIFIFFTINVSSDTKIGFGSCLDQRYPQKIWKSIADENINKFIFLGDNVYGDHPSGKLDKLRKSYLSQYNKLPKWLNKKKVISIWDDHDYGINDGGSDFKNKRESQKLFLDFWKIPEDDLRHKRYGLYFNELIEIDNFTLNLIVLDTRFFRSKLTSAKSPYVPTNNTDTTILGDEQWNWFKEVINRDSDLILVLSSIQILATEHVFERWDLFPHERLKMIKILNAKDTKTLIISGDRHKGGLYKKGDLIELTSSSLNKPTSAARISRSLPVVPNAIKKQLIEDDKLLQNKIYNYENFGLIKINTKTQNIEISLNDISGNEVFTYSL